MPARRSNLNRYLQIGILTTVLVALGCSFLAYKSYRMHAGDRLANQSAQLLTIVKTAALQIDPQLHQSIQYQPTIGLTGSDAFNQIRDQLVAIRDANNMAHGKGSPIYTLRKPTDFESSRELEIVAMSDVGMDGRYYSGARFTVQDLHLRNFSGYAATSKVYYDMEGPWISAAAPMFVNGEVVGIVHSDRSLDAFTAELLFLRNQYIGLVLVCVLLAAASSTLATYLYLRFSTTQPAEKKQSKEKTEEDKNYIYLLPQPADTVESIIESINEEIDAEETHEQELSDLLASITEVNESTEEFHAHAPNSTPHNRVLMANDDINAQLYLTMAFEDYGIDVVIVDNGKQVLERLLVDHFDIVLLKARMPILDGERAAELIREDKHFETLPIVLMKNSVDADEQRELVKKGINGVIDVEPSSAQLGEMLDQLLGTKHDESNAVPLSAVQ